VTDRIPPSTAAEALAEARRHGQRAAAESALALRALLDAATLAARGEPASSGRLAPLAEALERASAWLGEGGGDRSGDAVLRALADGLDAEIARWEAKSREDPEARSVLRAFLAVREVLFEMSTRFGSPRESEPESEPAEPEPRADTEQRSTRSARPRRARRRVERVAVEG
jgi:hypothetical protein